MKKTGHLLLTALVVGVPLAALLLLTGCELSGQYEGDNVKAQFGNTNAAAPVQPQ
jgi:hypothetical protein